MPSITLEQVIARVPLFAGKKAENVSSLSGGITNENFRVEVDGRAYVVRIVGEDTELLGIRRENEFAANEAAAEVGVGPGVAYFLRPEGILITDFVKGRPIPPEEMRRPESIRRVVQSLRPFHKGRPIPDAFSPFRMVETYLVHARRLQAPFPEDIDWFFEKASEMETAMLKDPFAPQPCHNDLLNLNFIDAGDRVIILDWEYAGMGDVCFDLGNFAVHHEFGEEQDRLLVEEYLGRYSEPKFARVKLMKIMSDFREAMWGEVQINLSKLEEDFVGYANKHFGRFRRNAADPRYAEWLELVGTMDCFGSVEMRPPETAHLPHN